MSLFSSANINVFQGSDQSSDSAEMQIFCSDLHHFLFSLITYFVYINMSVEFYFFVLYIAHKKIHEPNVLSCPFCLKGIDAFFFFSGVTLKRKNTYYNFQLVRTPTCTRKHSLSSFFIYVYVHTHTHTPIVSINKTLSTLKNARDQ